MGPSNPSVTYCIFYIYASNIITEETLSGDRLESTGFGFKFLLLITLSKPIWRVYFASIEPWYGIEIQNAIKGALKIIHYFHDYQLV